MKKLDGITMQEEVASSLKLAISDLKRGRPKLAIFSVDANEETLRYVKKKKNFGLEVGCKIVSFLNSGAAWDTGSVIKEIKAIQKDCDGLVVQLPLPKTIDTKKVLEAILPEKDVDALREDTLFISPVALAVQYMLEKAGVWYNIFHEKVVVVGAGETVGKPVIKKLESLGVTPKVLTKETDQAEFRKALQNATVVISGAGVSGLITQDLIQENVVLVDAGFSFKNGKITGDIDSACFQKASFYSTVPGGVGPLAIAFLFQNLVEAKKKNTN